MSAAKDNPKKDYTLFAQEEEAMSQAKEMVLKLESVASGVRTLADAYGRQYHEQQKLLRLSDRIQLELQKANQRLAEQAEELNKLNAALSAEIEQRKKLEQELRTLATTDSLTGLLTRRHFFELGQRELKVMARRGTPLSVMLLDLDHFKQINDRHGHAAGDQMLTGVADVFRGCLRGVDLLGRLGGEEFGVILPDTDLEATRLVSERLRSSLARWSFSPGGQTVTVTVSIGITELKGPEPSLETAFTRADQALYQAKAQGRDRSIAWEDLPTQD